MIRGRSGKESKTIHLPDERLIEAGARGEEAANHLETCAECRVRRDAALEVRGAIAKLDRQAPAPPEAIALLLRAEEERPRAKARWARRAALGIGAAALASLVFAWATRRSPRQPLSRPLVDEIALDHLHYERRVEAAEVRGEPAELSAFFEDRIGFSPRLSAVEATTLAGGKACRIGGEWTALVWLERAGHWLSLFVMPGAEPSGRGCAESQGVRVCAVPDPGGGARVVVGALPPAEMLRLAEESQR